MDARSGRVQMNKFKSHVGLDQHCGEHHLFGFQLIGSGGLAEAIVDFENGILTRILTTSELSARKPAIQKLAGIYLHKSLKKSKAA